MKNALAKIIAGPQAGAEFTLVPGTYVLGTGDSADLLLTDAAVRPRHAAVTADAGQWRVEPLEGTVTVNGAAVDGPTVLEPYAVVGLGGVYLALGPEGEWETLPVVPAPKAAPADAAALPDVLPDVLPGVLPDVPPAATPAEAAPEREEPEVSPSAPAKEPALRRRFSGKILPACVGAAVLAAAGWHFAQPPDPVKAKIDRAVVNLARGGVPARSPVVGRLAPGSVGLDATADGKVRLTGLVAKDEDRARIPAVAGLPPDETENQLKTVEDSVGNANRAVAARFPDLAVEAERTGYTARIFGLADNVAQAGAAFSVARQNLDPDIPLRSGMIMWSEVRRDAEAAAERLGFGKGAWFERRDNDVALHASPWPTERQRRGLLNFLRARYEDEALRDFASALAAGPPEVELAATPIPAPEPDPGLQDWIPSAEPVQSGTTGAKPVTEAEDGTKPVTEAEDGTAPEVTQVAAIVDNGFFDQKGNYFEVGDFLAADVRLSAIWSDGVVLQWGKETIFAPRESEFALPEDEKFIKY